MLKAPYISINQGQFTKHLSCQSEVSAGSKTSHQRTHKRQQRTDLNEDKQYKVDAFGVTRLLSLSESAFHI